MSVIITIGGTPIQFPTSGSPASWAPPVVQFAETVADVLTGLVGPFDVVPQSFPLDTFNPGTAIVIPHLSFSPISVTSVEISYEVSRTTSVTSGYERGTLTMIYNPNSGSGSKWEVGRQYVGRASVTFTVSDSGQVEINTQTLPGSNHVARIAYSAKAFTVDQ